MVRTDLPKERKRPIQQAIEVLYERSFKGDKEKRSRNASRAEFASALKGSLDESFGEHWHVLIGDRTGFACKKRTETMAVWKIEENIVVMWQSPGYEEPGSNAAIPDGAGEKSKPGEAVKILEPEKVDDDTELAKVVDVLREELKTIEDDPQVLAQRLRNRLAADFGPIWHVVVGSDFVVEAAENRRNHVLLTAGKTRVVCFQHEQFTQGIKIDWAKIFRSAPYLLLAVFCLAYLTLNQVCVEGAELSGFQLNIRDRFCTKDWESQVHKVGVGAVVCLFAGRFVKKTQQKREAAAVVKGPAAAAAKSAAAKPAAAGTKAKASGGKKNK